MISEEYIVGLVEGEGCFSAAIQRVVDDRLRKTSLRCKLGRKNRTLGFGIRPSFRISLSKKDKGVLEEIRKKLGVGEIYVMERQKKNKNWASHAQYYVQTFKDLLKVREFFQRQTFYTTKGRDFQKWAKVLEIMETGRHLKKDGFLEILELREQMNIKQGKTTMRLAEEIKEKLYTKSNKSIRQLKLLHNQELCMPFLGAPLIKNP